MAHAFDANTMRGRAPGPRGPRADGPIGKNAPMSVTRIAWVVTVFVALLTGLLLLLGGYHGYAGLGLAVAIAAAINLL